MFKVGDEVFIKAEITDVHRECDKPYFVHPNLDSLNWVSEEKVFPADKTYTQGLADAWELAKKIGQMDCIYLDVIFGSDEESVWNHTYEEALAKIEAYEKEKKFCVGDEIVTIMGETFIILALADGEVYGYSNDGKHEDFPVQRIECYTESGRAEKTGKHIDVESLLRQIGE